MPSVNYLSIIEILYLHDQILAETGGGHGVLNPERLAAAVARPRAGYGDVTLYPTVHLKAAALLSEIVTTHPFVDGNKRTGIAAAAMFLEINGYDLVADQRELEEFAVSVALHNPEIDDIATWLQQHTVSTNE